MPLCGYRRLKAGAEWQCSRAVKQGLCHLHACRHRNCNLAIFTPTAQVKGAYSFCDQHCCSEVDESGARCKDGALPGATTCAWHLAASDDLAARLAGLRFGPQPQAAELCVICNDEVPRAGGLFCGGSDPAARHFVCDEDFRTHVRLACQPDQAGAFAAQGAHIYCPLAPSGTLHAGTGWLTASGLSGGT